MEKESSQQAAIVLLHESYIAHLEKESQRIRTEIHTYPPPIPACDAQFNYLIEQRARATQEARAAHALDVAAGNGDAGIRLRRLVADSQILGQKTKADLLGGLR